MLLRQRLFDTLDEAIGHAGIWINGPPGAGKTTLVSSYIHERALQFIWYQLDPDDSGVGSFFHFLTLAARQVYGDRAMTLPRLRPEYLSNPLAFSRRFFRELFIMQESPFVLVLDNYQEVPSNAVLHEIVRQALDQVPAGCTLVLISRTSPPPELLRLQANRQMYILDDAMLHLDMEEAVALSCLWPQWENSPDTVSKMCVQAHGWLAGMVLMLECGQHDENVEWQMPEMARESFFNYFTAEVFATMEEASRNVLMLTSLLSVVTAEQAEKLTGEKQADLLLEKMCRQHLFVERVQGESPSYRFHPLFREFLLSKAEKILAPGQLLENRCVAADLMASAGQTGEAIELYRQFGAWSSISALVCRQAPVLLAQGRSQVLARWISMLPEKKRLTDPWLLYWLACSRLPFNAVESRDIFERAFGCFKTGEERVGMLLAAAGAVEAVLTEWGDIKQLDRWSSCLIELTKAREIYPSADVEARVTFAIFASLMFRQPQHPDMQYWTERARHQLQGEADSGYRIMLGGYLSHYYFWIGDIASAGLMLETVNQLATAMDLSPLEYVVWKMQQAILYWHTASFEAALQCVNEGLNETEKNGIHLLDNWLMAQAVYASLSNGDLERARDFLDMMRPILGGRRYLDVGHYHYLSSLYDMDVGRIEQATQHARIALELAERAGTPFPVGLNSINMARICIQAGDKKQAKKHLLQARHIADAMGSSVLTLLVDVIRADDAFKNENHSTGLSALRRAMRVGRERNFVNFPGWQPKIMARLCQHALQAGIEVEYVRGLIRKRGLIPDIALPVDENWPWPVKVTTLGGFSLWLDGRLYKTSGKAQQKPLELLKVLIAMENRSLVHDQFADMLWPDTEGDKARHALFTTLHRLRKLLEHEETVLIQQHRLTLNPSCCWVDVLAFEQIQGKLTELLASTNALPDEVSRLSGYLLSLYRGEFLAGETDAWVLSCREHLRGKFLHCLTVLADFWERGSEWERAVELYQRALDTDALSEGFYQRLMLCQLRLGRRAEALAAYRRCRNNLRTHLGINPSHQTNAIRDRIINTQ